MSRGIFISYARPDAPFARQLYAVLAEAGHDAWLDFESLPPDLDWRRAVKQAIAVREVFAFVVSRHSLRSAACLRELRHAVTGTKRIVPVLRRDADASARTLLPLVQARRQ